MDEPVRDKVYTSNTNGCGFCQFLEIENKKQEDHIYKMRQAIIHLKRTMNTVDEILRQLEPHIRPEGETQQGRALRLIRNTLEATEGV